MKELLESFVKQLNLGLRKSENDPGYAVLGVPGIEDRTVLTIVNFAEEAALKNQVNHQRSGTKVTYRNPSIYLNVFLLVSCTGSDYLTALERIGNVALLFQGENRFVSTVTSVPTQISVELLSLSLEQVNHLWSNFGGKQLPFLLYKLRFVEIQADRTLREGGVIEELVGITSHLERS